MIDENEKRELTKVHDTLRIVADHLSHKDQMNAALHMSETVRPTPLSAAVDNAIHTLYDLIK